MTVTVVYSADDDGRFYSQNATYATARTGSSLAYQNVNPTVAQVLDGGVYYCIQSGLRFDTSSIPDGDTVWNVTLQVAGASTDSATAFEIEIYPKNLGAAVESGDFESGASVGALGILSDLNSDTEWSPSVGFNTFPSSAAFAAAINKTGDTGLIVVDSLHRVGTAPSTGWTAPTETIDFYGAEGVGGTTFDPTLTITHAAAAGDAVPTAWVQYRKRRVA